MLIDAGNNGDGKLVKNYLLKQDIKSLYYVIGTHPHEETMDKLKNKNILVYRTDELGTIIATSDEKTITFNTRPGSYKVGVR